ncbi:MAG: tryptophan--tRNA ligase, partial [Acidobacteria bacterium]|nr:tryptophan--tRNA ligase [Acidobacteriota bacterium]
LDLTVRSNSSKSSGLKSRLGSCPYAPVAIEHIEPFQQRYREMMADPAYLDGILKAGAERVQPIAAATVQLVKERMGLYTASR